MIKHFRDWSLKILMIILCLAVIKVRDLRSSQGWHRIPILFSLPVALLIMLQSVNNNDGRPCYSCQSRVMYLPTIRALGHAYSKIKVALHRFRSFIRASLPPKCPPSFQNKLVTQAQAQITLLTSLWHHPGFLFRFKLWKAFPGAPGDIM